MKIYYSDDQLPTSQEKSIFLAGPTPRTQDIKSWRKKAVKILEDINFDGSVFIPEPKNGWKHSYLDQVEWEELGLNMATVIAFWVPRDIKNGMPGFTTNDEFGAWKNSGKVVWGSPKNADKVKYQLYYAKKLNIPISNTLSSTMENAVDLLEQICFIRASGSCKCIVCGDEFIDHPMDNTVLDFDNKPFLHVLCDRRRVKL